MAKTTKVQISERALLQRVNRKLAAEDQQVLRQRAFYDDQGRGPIYRDQRSGRYYIVDLRINGIVAQDVDIEELAKEVGALKAWEELQAE